MRTKLLKWSSFNTKGLIFLIKQEESLSALPVMFDDVKGYSMSPMHMRPRWVQCRNVWLNLNPGCLRLSGMLQLTTWQKRRSARELASLAQSTLALHPSLHLVQRSPGPLPAAPRTTCTDASNMSFKRSWACGDPNLKKSVIVRSDLKSRCFFPEPQKGGNSNTGNLATR